MQEIHTLMLPCPQPFSPAMSGVALADTRCLHKKPAHRRDVSDELDVFEAASYYSGVTDAASFRRGTVSHRPMKEERRVPGGGGRERRSIDVPTRGPLPSESHKAEKQAKEEKKSKLPISPGGRLASFLNSFFHQGSSKKKSKSIAATRATRSSKNEDESSSGRRKRRSSISHSHSTSSSKSSFVYSSKSGFRTPPLAYPPGKANVDTRTRPRNKCNGHPTPAASHPPTEGLHEGKSSYGDLTRERSRRASTNGISEKAVSYYSKIFLDSDGAHGNGCTEKKWVLNKDSKGMVCRDLLRADGFLNTDKCLWRREEVEDGGESDSSSDLFELPNYDLVHLSSGLSVYDTTSRETINMASPIANVTL